MLVNTKETVKFIANNAKECKSELIELFFSQLANNNNNFETVSKKRVLEWMDSNINHWRKKELIKYNAACISKNFLRLHRHRYAPELNKVEFKNGVLIDAPHCTTISHSVVEVAKKAILKPEILKLIGA